MYIPRFISTSRFIDFEKVLLLRRSQETTCIKRVRQGLKNLTIYPHDL
jgi:hypothetical protein